MHRHHQCWRLGSFRRIAADASAAGEREAQESIGHFVFDDQIAGEISQSVIGERHSDVEKFCAATESFEMLGPAEWPAGVDQHRFEQAIAIEKATVKNGDDRL